MTVVDPAAIRQRSNSFSTSWRGYERAEVTAYLGRLALALEVAGAASTSPAGLPPDLAPDLIRAKTFLVVWRGLNRNEVRSFLGETAAAFPG